MAAFLCKIKERVLSVELFYSYITFHVDVLFLKESCPFLVQKINYSKQHKKRKQQRFLFLNTRVIYIGIYTSNRVYSAMVSWKYALPRYRKIKKYCIFRNHKAVCSQYCKVLRCTEHWHLEAQGVLGSNKRTLMP